MKSSFLESNLTAFTYLMSHKRQRSTCVWTSPARSALRYTSVFILALTRDPEARGIVETDLAAVATSRGLKAVRSVDVYPANLMVEGGPTKGEIWGTIQALGCDAIFTVSLLDVKSHQYYSQAQGAYAPYPQHSYYGGFNSYYEHLQPEVSCEGYYSTEKTYFLEGNVFDAATGQIQWSMQSIAYEPADLESFSKEYALLLVDQLNKPKELCP
ncbi:MAG: hypothetical protein H6Q30_331 [Bacteroidetes bacterium]|nr:hypothetical protein [Bacteroidota bacterium]